MSGQIQKLGMPKWDLSMTEGRLIEWLVNEDARVAVGDEVAEVETDKLKGSAESPVAGVLRRRVASPGELIPVGGMLGLSRAQRWRTRRLMPSWLRSRPPSFPARRRRTPAPLPRQSRWRRARCVTYGRAGKATTSCFLHGFRGDLNKWLFAAPVLAEGHTVDALELPGHGGSSKDVGGGDLGYLVDAVAQFLDALSLARVHLVGHSLGGLGAAGVALRGPSRAESLTLVASAGLGEEINSEYVERFVFATSRRDLKPALELLFADSDQVTRQLVDDVLKYKHIDGVDAALRSMANQIFAGGQLQVFLADRLAELEVPLLVF